MLGVPGLNAMLCNAGTVASDGDRCPRKIKDRALAELCCLNHLCGAGGVISFSGVMGELFSSHSGKGRTCSGVVRISLPTTVIQTIPLGASAGSSDLPHS